MSCWNPSEPAAARGLSPLTALTAAGEHNWTPAWFFWCIFFLSFLKENEKAAMSTEAKRPKRSSVALNSAHEVVFLGFFFWRIPSSPNGLGLFWVGWGPAASYCHSVRKIRKKKSETQGAVDD